MATKKPTTETTQVVERQQESLVLVQNEMPDYLKPQGDAPARGSENVTTEDIVIPRLEMVQGLSPAVKEGDPGYIEGARPGMLFNSVTRELYGKEVTVVPVFYTKQYLVWKKRKTPDGKALEGGFFGAFPNSMDAKERADQEGGEAAFIEVIDTPQHLCLVVNADGEISEIMVSMPRTKNKISRQWNSIIKLAGGDRFSRVYRVGTTLEKNPKGDYYNFAVSQSGFPAKALYDKAEKLYTAVVAGIRNVVVDTSDFEGDGHGSTVDPDAEM